MMERAVRICPDRETGRMEFPAEFICYGKDRLGRWWFKHRDSKPGLLLNHMVTEHEDKTITVRPDILGPKNIQAFGRPELNFIHGRIIRGWWEPKEEERPIVSYPSRGIR